MDIKQILSVAFITTVLYSCNEAKKSNQSGNQTETKDIAVQTVTPIDTTFGYISPKIISKVADAIFVSGVLTSDTLKIKEELAFRDKTKIEEVVLYGQCCLTSEKYSKLYIPEDDKFAYLNGRGKEIRFVKKSGKAPYYGDSFKKDTKAIYENKETKDILTILFNVEIIKLELNENGVITKTELMPLAGTD